MSNDRSGSNTSLPKRAEALDMLAAILPFDLTDLFAVDRAISEDRERDAVCPDDYRSGNHRPVEADRPGAMSDASVSTSVAAKRRAVPLRTGQRNEALLDLGEQRRRQGTVVACLGFRRTHIRSRPDEPIAFRKNDPRALVVQAEAPLRRRRNLDGLIRIGWWCVRHGQDPHNRRAILKRADDRQNDGGPILVPLFPPLEVLPMPKIGIAEYPADPRFSRQHSCPSSVRC